MPPRSTQTAPDPFPVEGSPPDAYRLSAGAAGLVALYAASMLSISFALHPDRALTHHEVMFAQPAREMLASGDWLVPTNLGVPCTHKPPGLNWLVALAMAATGSDCEVVVRLPTALAGVAAAVLVAWLGARFFGRRVGVVAGLVQATTYYALRLSRVAEADIVLTALVCAATACFAAGAVESPGARSRARWLPWLFYLLAGLSFLVKGLVGPVFVFGACGLYAAWAMVRERDGRPMRFLASPIGMGLFLLPVLGWAVPAFLRCPAYLDDQILHHFGRMRGEQGGARDPFFYFYSIPLVLLPWTPFVVGGLVVGLRRRATEKGVQRPSKAVEGLVTTATALEGRRTRRFATWLKGYPVPFCAFWRLAACWIVPGLAVLCLSVFKRDHYLAPLMPPLSVAGAVGLVAFAHRPRHRARREFALGAGGIVAGCAAGLAAVMVLTPPGYVELAWVTGLLGAGLLATLCLEHFHSPAAHLAGTFATVWLVAVGVLGFVMPHHDSYREETQFARRVDALVPDGEPLYLVDLYENQVYYYLKPPLVRVDDPGQLAARVGPGGGDVYLLAGEETGRARAGLGRLEVLDQCPNRRWYLAGRGRLTLFRRTKKGPGLFCAKHPSGRSGKISQVPLSLPTRR